MSYADLHRRFGLPDPPARSLFSRNHGVEYRAWLPDFTRDSHPVSSLTLFLNEIFYPTLSKSTFTQLKVLSVLVGIVGVAIFLIIVRRLYERSFWLFRLSVRSNGTLIIPNAIAVFVMIEATFAIILIAFCWEFVDWFQNKANADHIMLWIGLPWYPLILGAYASTVGTMYARPDALSWVSPQPGKPASRANRFGITPSVINLSIFAVPVLQALSIVVPAAISEIRYAQAAGQFREFVSSLDPNAELTREMLIEAQQIWYKVLDAAYYLSICMTIWEAWVCALWLSHFGAGASLLIMLRKQIKTLSSFKQNKSISDSFAAAQQDQQKKVLALQTYKLSAVPEHEDAPNAAPEAEKLAPYQQQEPPVRAPSTVSTKSADLTLSPSGDGVVSKADTAAADRARKLSKRQTQEEEDRSEASSDQIESMFFTREQMENQDKPAAGFFPPVRPSAFERPEKAHTKTGKRRSHQRYLQLFYWNFFVQWIGLDTGILFFATFCGWLTTAWYTAWEANRVAPTIQIAMLVVSWTTLLCASVVIFAILSRTYEPIMANFAASSHPKLTLKGRAGSVSQATGSDPGSRESRVQSPRSLRRGSALSWAAGAISQLSHTDSSTDRDVGLERLGSSRNRQRSGTGSASALEGLPRRSLHAYREIDEGDSTSVNAASGLDEEAAIEGRRPSDQTAIARGGQARKSSEHSPSHSSTRGDKRVTDGIVVQRTVVTTVGDPAMSDFDLPSGGHAELQKTPSAGSDGSTASSRIDPFSPEVFLSSGSKYGVNFGGIQSPATPGTIWTPVTPASADPLLAGKDGATFPSPVPSSSEGHSSSGSLREGNGNDAPSRTNFRAGGTRQPSMPNSPERVRRSMSSRKITSRGSDSTISRGPPVGLGIGSSAWTAPAAWGSPEPHPELLQQDLDRRQRNQGEGQ
ncbi:hypothetical protein BCV70DRAFT_1404 [Testicularia cyperi]|uniref:Uncharacterized protein n=1 Tax=Testicularia cyperi TaxID=1882483 RepID=A0A317XYT4_9BASI|nr:hypothetical protein BCV70DRAFT_1404 [Testicularia cyperi]